MSQNTGDPSPYLATESARMAELAAAGAVEQVFVKADYSGVVLIATATSAEALGAALDTLPMRVNGLTSFTLTEIVAAPLR